ncbi:hypothetical protein BDV93DRAFT_81122 [Ceratobasidium sp. AG-I]|nr:hypothetical protein BDV93DRAFT_81122 [Ceratobasidium sp. AG-I]
MDLSNVAPLTVRPPALLFCYLLSCSLPPPCMVVSAFLYRFCGCMTVTYSVLPPSCSPPFAYWSPGFSSHPLLPPPLFCVSVFLVVASVF